MESLGMDAGGRDSIELENRRGRKVTVGSNPTPSATESGVSGLFRESTQTARVPCDARCPSAPENKTTPSNKATLKKIIIDVSRLDSFHLPP